jgi:hypothetical protein
MNSLSTAGTLAAIQAQQDSEIARMGDPLRGTPGASEWARNAGFKLSYDGSYKRITNIGGAQQIESLSPDQIQRDYLSRQYLQQASALPQGSPDYLSQIMPMLNAQRATQAQGGASSGQYSNPYEQRLAALINNPDAIENTNAYKFRFNQGQQALERSAAAKGMLNSGNTLAELARYGQGMASEEYGNEFNRLATATGQRNQYNLGLMGAANQEYALRSQDRQNDTGIALKALMGSDEMYNQRKKLALDAATAGGMLKTGNQQKYTATW